jgi:antitoxin component of MazEF toxin-antitoxin module
MKEVIPLEEGIIYLLQKRLAHSEWRPYVTKTLTKHGNSLALVIDKPILEQMGVAETSPLTLAFDGRCLIVTRVSSTARHKRVRSAIDELHHEFGYPMKRLEK